MFEEIRKRLIDKGMKIKQLARITGIAYDRLTKCMNGFAKFREYEKERIYKALGLKEEEGR